MPNDTCPVCGYDGLQRKTVRKILTEPFGGETSIDICECVCPSCGVEGDLFNENDAIIEKEIAFLKNRAAVNILDHFATHGRSLASMERVLDLPQRTLAKWKNRSVSPSAAGVTLLKFLRTFPWLLEVAAEDFDQTSARKIFLKTALNKFVDEMQSSEVGLQLPSPISALRPISR